MGHAQVVAPSVRYSVEPIYVPAEKAARMLHLTPGQFADCLPRLLVRGFPPADPDTGMFQREAVERWSRAQYPRQFPELTAGIPTVQPRPAKSMGARFREAQERKRHG